MTPACFVPLFLALVHYGNALTCLQCVGVAHPRHCRFVTDCSYGEVCSAEAVTTPSGRYLYNIGCIPTDKCLNTSSDATNCHQCCNTDLCNAWTCAEAGYPAVRGPICYHCPTPVDENTCDAIEFCETDQACYSAIRQEFGELVYVGSCTSKSVCSASGLNGNVIIGRDLGINYLDSQRSIRNEMCEECCGHDLCNKHCSPIEQATDCYDIQSMGIGSTDGIYKVRLWKSGTVISVYCDLTTDGGGWTVFQKRFNGSVDFYRNFANYTYGFGDLSGEFWLGLDYIHEITTKRATELRIDLTASTGSHGYEVFRNFYISEGPGYNIKNDLGSGPLGHDYLGLSYNVNMAFTTFDHDNDNYLNNCAINYHGAWWYKVCGFANLNGLYMTPGIVNTRSMFYFPFTGSYASLKTSKMMFKPQV